MVLRLDRFREGAGEEAGSAPQEIGAGEKREHFNAPFLQRLTTALLAIDQDEGKEHLAALGLIASTALRVEPPVVITSSTTTMESPGEKLPSIRRPTP